MMASRMDARIIGEVIDIIADQALAKGEHANVAIEQFSGAVDRLLEWLPADLRAGALELARAHGYCTADQIATMRLEKMKH